MDGDLVPLVALLACHTTSGVRLAQVRQCLASIAAQAGKPPLALLASISAESLELLEQVRAEFDRFQVAIAGRVLVRAHFHARRRHQFQHFEALAEPLRQLARELVQGSSLNNTAVDANMDDWVDEEGVDAFWLLFTDDDDIWHPCRTLIFRRVIADTLSASKVQHAPVAVPVYAMNTASVAECADSADVDELMRSGRAGILSYSPEEARQRSFLEYWLHAVPARVFLDFLVCTPPATLAHGLCDIRFATFIRDHAGFPTALFTPPMPHVFWMYFHRQHDSQVTRDLKSAASVTLEDVQLADSLRKSLSGCASMGTGDPVAQLVAEIRRDVEAMVLYGRVPPEDIVEASLRRHSLHGTPDAPAWARLAHSLAAQAIPVLAPPDTIGAPLQL